MVLSRPNLFKNNVEFIIIVFVFIIIILFRLTILYQEYQEFISKPFYYTDAIVLKQYNKIKNGKSYVVLKLKTTDEYNIYTTSYIKKNITLHKIRIKILINRKITFFSYLNSFYSPVIIKNIYEKVKDKRDYFLTKIQNQHQNSDIIDFYQAIFLVKSINQSLRKSVSLLGVSHLIALSGFHLSILWGIIFTLLSYIYKPLQQRYFPYRYNLIDLGFISLVVLAIYVWFVGYPPSLIRSFVMLLSIWILSILGMNLVSFQFLLTIVLLILSINPLLIASISFWYSIAGVFYIYLILEWSKERSSLVISIIYIPFGIFIMMLPIVHLFFNYTSIWQLLSPILSILFIPFYPLSIFLHLINIGYIFDEVLLSLFALPRTYFESNLSVNFGILYIITNIASIWSRFIFIFNILLAFIYALYLFWRLF